MPRLATPPDYYLEEDEESEDVALDDGTLDALYALTPGVAVSVEQLADAFDHPRFTARRAVERVHVLHARRPPVLQRRGPTRRTARRRVRVTRRARARSPDDPDDPEPSPHDGRAGGASW